MQSNRQFTGYRFLIAILKSGISVIASIQLRQSPTFLDSEMKNFLSR